MSIFCAVNSNNQVIESAMVEDADVVANGGHQSNEAAAWFQGQAGLPVTATKWVESSEDGSFRGQRAGIGFVWDEAKNAFYLPQPFASWTLNETSWEWEAPVASPDGENCTTEQKDIAEWDESGSQWYYIDASENRFNWDASALNWVAA